MRLDILSHYHMASHILYYMQLKINLKFSKLKKNYRTQLGKVNEMMLKWIVCVCVYIY